MIDVLSTSEMIDDRKIHSPISTFFNIQNNTQRKSEKGSLKQQRAAGIFFMGKIHTIPNQSHPFKSSDIFVLRKIAVSGFRYNYST